MAQQRPSLCTLVDRWEVLWTQTWPGLRWAELTHRSTYYQKYCLFSCAFFLSSSCLLGDWANTGYWICSGRYSCSAVSSRSVWESISIFRKLCFPIESTMILKLKERWQEIVRFQSSWAGCSIFSVIKRGHWHKMTWYSRKFIFMMRCLLWQGNKD